MAAERLGRLALVAGHHVGVDRQRHHGRSVAEALADHVHRLAGQQEQRGVRVAQVVRAP
jgi:hypothetical protein